MIAKVDRAAAIAALSAVVDWLRARPDANGRVGAIGFCWGGGMANALAVAVPSLDAAVPFYGVAPPSTDVARIRARLPLHYAGNDPRINAASSSGRTQGCGCRVHGARVRRHRARVPQRHRGRALQRGRREARVDANDRVSSVGTSRDLLRARCASPGARCNARADFA
jgi:dienelactone hydrolase